MLLHEMFEPAIEGLQDIENDNSRMKWKDARKSVLTLRQINKLRKMTEVRSFEQAEHLTKVRKQYAPPKQPTM